MGYLRIPRDLLTGDWNRGTVPGALILIIDRSMVGQKLTLRGSLLLPVVRRILLLTGRTF